IYHLPVEHLSLKIERNVKAVSMGKKEYFFQEIVDEDQTTSTDQIETTTERHFK
ncbi:8035_t:CDS:2, partial [Racocetra persica]